MINMSDCIMKLFGTTGEVELYEDKIIIKREGVLAKLTHGFFKGDKTIYLNQITSIQIKAASMFINGYIQFSVSGGIESTKGVLDASGDENSVIFDKKSNDIAYEIQRKIEELNSKQNVQSSMETCPVDEIRKYKALLDENIITQDEYEAKKKQLLNI